MAVPGGNAKRCRAEGTEPPAVPLQAPGRSQGTGAPMPSKGEGGDGEGGGGVCYGMYLGAASPIST